MLLNATNSTSNYALSGAYFPCSSASGDTVWNITATQIGSLKIYDATISNATLKLTGTIQYNETSDSLVSGDDNSTLIANSTVWSGLVSGSFKYPPFSATALIEFNTTHGVRNFRANVGYRSNSLDVDMLVEYDRTSIACQSPTPLTVLNTSRPIGPGEFGSATITIRGVGSSNLTMLGSARHDYCDDIWKIDGMCNTPLLHEG